MVCEDADRRKGKVMTAVHNRKWLAGLILGVAVLAGCGAPKAPDTVEQTSLIIDKEGGITSHMVDVFDKAHYDINELREMATAEVAAYNTANQSGTEAPITMEKVEALQDSKVLVTYKYRNAKVYETYNDSALFYGTVAEAKAAGYNFDSLNQVLFNAKGDGSMVSGELSDSKMADRHVVLLEEKTLVYCPAKVAYASESAVLKEDGSVDTTAMLPEEFPVIIVLDK